MIKPKRSLHESHARARGQNRVLRRETEEDPSSDVDDDFPTDDFDTPAGLAAREAEHERAAAAAVEAGVPARRSGRAASAAATAAADAARERERASMPTD